MKKNSKHIIIFILPTILLFGLVYAASLTILIGTSFTDWRIGTKPVFKGIENYVVMFTSDSDFWVAFRNTGIWIILQMTVHVSIGVVFALILAQKEFYWKVARTIYMIPNIISAAAEGMLFLLILNPQFGAVNGILRIIGFENFSHNWFMSYDTAFLSVTMTWLPFAPVVSILILAEIAAIPDSIFEAAKVDGASPIKTNIYIVIPMLRNIIGTCVILAGTSMLQKMDIIMMTTGGGPGNETLNLPAYIYRAALTDNNFSYANSIGVFLIILGVVIVLSTRRLFKMGTSHN